jgi:hypothetical protein
MNKKKTTLQKPSAIAVFGKIMAFGTPVWHSKDAEAFLLFIGVLAVIPGLGALLRRLYG